MLCMFLPTSLHQISHILLHLYAKVNQVQIEGTQVTNRRVYKSELLDLITFF